MKSHLYRSVLDKMVSKLGKEVQINLKQRVTKVDYNEDVIKVYTANGKSYQADHVISTMSLGTVRWEDFRWNCKSIQRGICNINAHASMIQIFF